jgi:poly-gamma-glutamate capsule biosynthesis protein CapA/YwtB (metallophosphatase superfamily)
MRQFHHGLTSFLCQLYPVHRSKKMSSPTQSTFTLLLLGDVMLGRLIDQLLPSSVPAPEDASHATYFRQRHPHLKDYNHLSPFGNALTLMNSSTLVLANLETAATLHPNPWPNKVFNYRTHPANIHSLVKAGVDYVSLANNHTLDFGKQGLLDTARAVGEADIAFAGAGETAKDAKRPALLQLTNPIGEPFEVHCYSLSDHPSDWASIELFNHIDYTSASREKVKAQLSAPVTNPPALKVVSIHWGPNYQWQPASEIRSLARWLVEECDVDLIHGHSSHHIQGVEVIESKGRKALIIYGCGDFVDDYAVNDRYRNDLSAAWRVHVAAEEGQDRLRLEKLEVFPNRIKTFQANLLKTQDEDHSWIVSKFRSLCDDMGTQVNDKLGEEGQIIVRIT